ncbi:type II secretion system protein GspF [Pseudomonas agarici]|uniref:Type II secretion system protein GspF n=1 Tax=Pseudomonas agarici TaxID=46677 RepID=A0A0X1T1U1_PSEAA|nr:type II secretion system inner membrane protein GspF [Pseudomonas agarici]AMB86066.1 type II secretion system protein GspF [Pseudomonas agarici]NWC07505.1 type II secretion system inner membrane protein GspF [Pseudomonas agarici]SEK42192.1 type II secretion system protein F (GspF) [Pseudomonas agarici]
MEHYRYRALDPNGNALAGALEAENDDAAASQLQERGLLVLQLEPTAFATVSSASWFKRPPLVGDELERFTQQLATLLDAGQPLERALNILARQPGKPQSRRLLERIRDRVKGGQPLSTAMAVEGPSFSPLYLSLVRAGEAGGALGDTLGQLANYLERTQKVRGEVINALIYPAFLLVGVLGSLVLLLAYVVPQFVPIFSGLGVPVPLITEVILGLGQFLGHYILYLLGAMALLCAWLGQRLRTAQGRLQRDRLMLRTPVVGPLLLRLETARLAHTLGTLLSQGVALISAFDIARQVCRNQVLRDAVELTIGKVKDGSRLSVAMDSTATFPELAIQMIQVGEESGQLDRLLLKVASIFDAEAKRHIDRLLAALVPSLTLVMAVLVGVIMLAIMLPLMSLTNNL